MKKDAFGRPFLCAFVSCLTMTQSATNKKKSSRLLCCFFVECPAKLSNFFEDFNKIVEFIEKHCVLNKGYNNK